MGVSYSITALKGTNKTGVLKPDEDGYYTVVVGGFETSNVHGARYAFTPTVKALFDSSSQFQRQISKGILYGEFGHPKLMPGERIADYIRRASQIDEANISHHFRRVYLDDKNIIDERTGKAIVAILAEIKPLGPMGKALKDILDTKGANCCFSVRAHTNDKMVGGVESREVYAILTFDFVIEPGVPTSEKYKSPKLESYISIDIDEAIASELEKEINTGTIKMESSGGLFVKNLIESYRPATQSAYKARSSSW